MNKECYYCEKEFPEDKGFFVGEFFVCDDCEDLVGEDSTGYCSAQCILSGQCDDSC